MTTTNGDLYASHRRAILDRKKANATFRLLLQDFNENRFGRVARRTDHDHNHLPFDPLLPLPHLSCLLQQVSLASYKAIGLPFVHPNNAVIHSYQRSPISTPRLPVQHMSIAYSVFVAGTVLELQGFDLVDSDKGSLRQRESSLPDETKTAIITTTNDEKSVWKRRMTEKLRPLSSLSDRRIVAVGIAASTTAIDSRMRTLSFRARTVNDEANRSVPPNIWKRNKFLVIAVRQT
ncbi:hypothetical protein C8F01DRAFT_1242439 [Mycena amicta]|nr:hypothetical protein C8F01DRAFT_1242439 [Mycena amicta]